MSEFVERVRRIRQMRRWDQAEVATKMDYSVSVVSHIEQGKMTPTDDQLRRLADALGYSTTFLKADLGIVGTTRPLLRAYADASKKEADARTAAAITAVECIRLLHLKPFPDLIPPLRQIDADDDDAVEEAAIELRELAQLPADGVVPNVIRAAERLGCVVMPFDSELGRHIGMSLRSDGIPVICVANSMRIPGDRQRHTVAHELGHLTLHSHRPPPRDSRESTQMERQANRFAAAFLAPAEPILESLEEVGGRLTLNALVEVKVQWGISVKSLVGRYKTLGRIDPDQARSLYKQISARGWNKDEPVHVDTERAQWMSRSLLRRTGAEDLRSAAHVAAQSIGANPGDLQAFADWETSRSAKIISIDSRRPRHR